MLRRAGQRLYRAVHVAAGSSASVKLAEPVTPAPNSASVDVFSMEVLAVCRRHLVIDRVAVALHLEGVVGGGDGRDAVDPYALGTVGDGMGDDPAEAPLQRGIEARRLANTRPGQRHVPEA